LNTTPRVCLYTVQVCVCVDCSFLSLTWRPWCLAWKRVWPVSRDWMNSRRVERPRWVSTSSVTCWATSVHNSADSKSSGTSRGWEGNRGPAVESHVEQHMSTTQPTASHQVRHEAGKVTVGLQLSHMLSNICPQLSLQQVVTLAR